MMTLLRVLCSCLFAIVVLNDARALKCDRCPHRANARCLVEHTNEAIAQVMPVCGCDRTTENLVSEEYAISVRRCGAKGDGSSDDTVPIQAAIDAAKLVGVRQRSSPDSYTNDDRLGATVYFPPGKYIVSAPVIMPRSGSHQAHTIALKGGGRESTILVASKAFPGGRAIIEWEGVPKKVVNQTITDLGFDIENPATNGVMAIHYAPTAKATQQDLDRESFWWLTLARVTCASNTARNVACFYFEGRIDAANIQEIRHDSNNVAGQYSTTLLLFDDISTAIHGKWLRTTDTNGLNYSYVRGLAQGGRGGRGNLFEGRASYTSISDLQHGVGSLDTGGYGVRLKNCGGVTVANATFEGRGEDAEIQIDSCSGVTLENIGLGITTRPGSRGIRIINSEYVTMNARPTFVGQDSFSRTGGKALEIDGLSTHCRFEGFTAAQSFAKEISWNSNGANGNYIEYTDVRSGMRTVLDEMNPVYWSSKHSALALPKVASGTCSAETMESIPGITLGAYCSVAAGTSLEQGGFFRCAVTAESTLKWQFCNLSGEAITRPIDTYVIRVLK